MSLSFYQTTGLFVYNPPMPNDLVSAHPMRHRSHRNVAQCLGNARANGPAPVTLDAHAAALTLYELLLDPTAA